MDIGFVGLGKMGMNMVTRFRKKDHRAIVYDRAADLIKQAEQQGCIASSVLEDMESKLSKPRAIWIMVPSGQPTEETVQAVGTFFEPDDVIIDGGNTKFHHDVRRAFELKTRGIQYLDAGTRGGIFGLQNRVLPDGRRSRSGCQTVGSDLHDLDSREWMGSYGWSRFRSLCKNGPQRS